MIMSETLIICKNWASVGWLTNCSLTSDWFSCSKRVCKILNGSPQQPYMCNHITTQCKDYWGMITHAMLQFITILIELPTSLPKINAIRLHVYCLYMLAPNSSLFQSDTFSVENLVINQLNCVRCQGRWIGCLQFGVFTGCSLHNWGVRYSTGDTTFIQ